MEIMPDSGRVLSILIVLLLALPSISAAGVDAVSQSQVASAESTVQTAFLAVQNADAQGGNVTVLVAQLNTALFLIQKATGENATNPAQAAADLANATSIAQKAAAGAGPIGQQGAAARQLQFYLSVGSAVVIVALAALIYAFGDRAYRSAWLRLHRSDLVKRVG